MSSDERHGQCPCCGLVLRLDPRGRLAGHVPPGLAARRLDGERCPASAPVRSTITVAPALAR